MKIKIELEYPDEQIAFFAESKKKPEDKDLNTFTQEFLTNLLIEKIVEPFIDNTIKQRREEETQILETMRSNAQAGINITVE
jgi:hypothetical protein